jgi:uncharacterized membrane protein HdeD (DUF308 family)
MVLRRAARQAAIDTPASLRVNRLNVSPGSSSEPYCQFGKRFLDGFSWLAPVTNNRLGDALNIEFVHEQLFFIEGDRVTDDVGYSEKGKRFSESEFGKPIRNLADLDRNGYWLVGRRYHPEAAREALATQEDGHYYSFFSNQCQDWADRLRRRMDRIEKSRGLPVLAEPAPEAKGRHFWHEKAPTVPASALFGLVAIALGVGSVLAPVVAAHRSLMILALFFIVSGLADVAYACHGRMWSQILQTIFFALLNLAGGVALLLDTSVAASWAGGVFGVALAVNGSARTVVALRARPFSPWALLAGLGMAGSAVLLFTRTVGERDAIFGLIIGFNLILGGAATLWLHWHASRERT